MSARPRTVVTERDRELFALLDRARWLSSDQIRRCLFLPASVNAVQKRMRKLVRAGFLHTARPSRTEPNYFRLTALSSSLVGGSKPRDRRLPGQVRHFTLINDLRLWFETKHEIDLNGFWAEWEYRSFSVHQAVIPDALVAIRVKEEVRRFAIEVDCATENAAILVNKITRYNEGTPYDREMSGLLIWLMGPRRIRAVVTACCRAGVTLGHLPCWIVDINQLYEMHVSSRLLINLDGLIGGLLPVQQSFTEILDSPARPS